MCRELLHIYGPFSINTFGVLICLGLLLFTYLVLYDPRRSFIVSSEKFLNILTLSGFAALIGGRLLYILTNWSSFENWSEIAAVWTGGFSLLGAFFTLLLIVPWYLNRHHIPILSFLDLVAVYLPLLQAISRIGCFLAGCCYGIPTTLAIGIVFKDPLDPCLADVPLHPTQLYSAGALLCIFGFLYWRAHYHHQQAAGSLILLYFILMSAERFILDFWRGDREWIKLPLLEPVSVAQLLSAGIFCVALNVYLYHFALRNHGKH